MKTQKVALLALIFSCVATQVAAVQTPVRIAADVEAIHREHCQRMESALKDMRLADRGIADELAALQAQIDLAQSGNAQNVDKMVGQTLAEVRALRKRVAAESGMHKKLVEDYSIWWSVYGNGITQAKAGELTKAKWNPEIERAAALLQRDNAALKDAEKRLDYWTERETESLSGGVVTSKRPPFALSDLKFRQRELLASRVQLQRDIRSLEATLVAASCRENVASKQSPRKPPRGYATWTGTWSRAEISGNLILTQTSDFVNGHYTWNDGSGEVAAKILDNPTTGVPELHGNFTERHYQGTFLLVLKGRHFTGRYSGFNRDTNGSISGPFNGTCVAGECLQNSGGP